MTKAKKTERPSDSKQKPAEQGAEGSRLQDYAQEASETGSVDKIRDILFGNQMKDYEKRFIRLEERMRKELRELREEMSKRLDSIEAFIKKEDEALRDRLKKEQSMRDDSTKTLSKEIKDAVRLISKNIEQLEEKQSKDSGDWRQQLLELSKNLSNEIQTNHKESSEALDRAVKELEEEKVARGTLSELFMGMAIRISDELAEKLNLQADKL